MSEKEMFNDNIDLVWGKTFTHIHMMHSASDCDGPLQSWQDFFPEPDSEYPIRRSVMSYVLSQLFDTDGDLRTDVEFRNGNEIVIGGKTDEGYSVDYMTLCADSCEPSEPTRRDVYAERMGY